MTTPPSPATVSAASLNIPAYARLRERLCEDIISGVWPLGSHMTLQKLSAHYGVSQNPVREALFQLQGDGVVELRNHRGAVIPEVDAQYIANMYDVRGAIERLLKSSAAQHATPAEREAIAAAAEAYEDAVGQGDPRSIVAANRAFHRAIYRAARNPVAVAMMEARSTLVDTMRARVGYGAERLDQAVRQHRAIVRAIRRGDADKAGNLALAHAHSSKNDLLARLARHTATGAHP